jgi:hydroxyacylglutathione hydrolase
MELLTRPIGPLQTNVSLVGDPRTREAIVIDGAIPGLPWIVDALGRHGWRLVLIVSTHGHWDHTGENAALQAWSGQEADDGVSARIAAHRADWHHLTDPQPMFAPFPIPPCVPAVELAEGGLIRFGDQRLAVLHTPGHTEGSVCLLSAEDGIIFSGDTLFAGGWGRVDLPGGDAEAMVESLAPLAGLEDAHPVVPGHGRETTIARERPLLELIAREGRLPG